MSEIPHLILHEKQSSGSVQFKAIEKKAITHLTFPLANKLFRYSRGHSNFALWVYFTLQYYDISSRKATLARSLKSHKVYGTHWEKIWSNQSKDNKRQDYQRKWESLTSVDVLHEKSLQFQNVDALTHLVCNVFCDQGWFAPKLKNGMLHLLYRRLQWRETSVDANTSIAPKPEKQQKTTEKHS